MAHYGQVEFGISQRENRIIICGHPNDVARNVKFARQKLYADGQTTLYKCVECQRLKNNPNNQYNGNGELKAAALAQQYDREVRTDIKTTGKRPRAAYAEAAVNFGHRFQVYGKMVPVLVLVFLFAIHAAAANAPLTCSQLVGQEENEATRDAYLLCQLYDTSIFLAQMGDMLTMGLERLMAGRNLQADEQFTTDMEKRKHEFLRIGKRKHEYLRFGKRKHEYLRFGKRKHEYLRFGKRHQQ